MYSMLHGHYEGVGLPISIIPVFLKNVFLEVNETAGAIG